MTHALPSPDAPLKIGTRGSPLALAQAYETRDWLAAAFDLPETGWSAAAGHATSWGGPGSVGVLVVRRGTRWSNPFPGDPEPQDFGGALPDVAGSLAAAAGEETRSSGLSKLASMKCGISTS